ncbi:MAG: serine/threonine-protein kinase [Myxococcota bacterium]
MPRIIHDRYAVVRQLGEGSSAVTYLCEDQEQEGLLVALKELRPEGMTHWKQFELFEREARVLRSLRHHGIPEVLDTFETEDSEGRTRLYLVTEYVEGASLKERIEQGPRMGQAELVQVTLGLLDILDYLHTRTPPIIHRDIKPSNILLRPTGAPVLIDFGGVRDGWRSTDAGGSTVVATHGYTPPEQYMGQVSGASDFYALGATLLHVVGGEPPYNYPLDSGRIELPDNLPTSDTMHELIARTLHPAPRERLQSAREARALLLAPTQPPPKPPPVVSPPPNIEPTPLAGSNAPQVVDLGVVPRSPMGEHKAIWDTLKYPFPIAQAILISAVSFGIALPFLLMHAWQHYKWVKPLFERGTFVRGRLVNNQMMPNGPRLIYEFDAGQRYRNSHHLLHHQGAHLLSPGDTVGVLYDPEDPSQSVLVMDSERKRSFIPPLLEAAVRKPQAVEAIAEVPVTVKATVER